jgi:hypothetical protein
LYSSKKVLTQAPQRRRAKKDGLGTAVYGTRESSGLPREMELEVEVEKMFERLARDGAHRALTDVCEYGVQQLAKHGRAYTSCTICRPKKEKTHFSCFCKQCRRINLRRTSENNRAADDPDGRVGIERDIERIDDFFEK